MVLETDKSLAVGVDVGGTGIRAAVVDQAGVMRSDITVFVSRADMDGETIISNFVNVIRTALTGAETEVKGIGIGIPGPFDYQAGISLMQGVAKYDSLYGVNLLRELQKRLPLRPEFPVRFINDAAAFALGEVYFGNARGYERVMAVTLGTGCGSAFLVGGKLRELVEGVGSSGYIFDLPYRDTIVDDYISRRGILRLWSEICSADRAGLEEMDVEQLAAAATGGDELYQQLFLTWGTMLIEALQKPIDVFQPDCLLLGGKISKSAHLFRAPVLAGLEAIEHKRVTLLLPQDLENAGIKGAAQTVLR